MIKFQRTQIENLKDKLLKKRIPLIDVQWRRLVLKGKVLGRKAPLRKEAIDLVLHIGRENPF